MSMAPSSTALTESERYKKQQYSKLAASNVGAAAAMAMNPFSGYFMSKRLETVGKDIEKFTEKHPDPSPPAPIPTPMDIESVAGGAGRLLSGSSRRRRKGKGSTILAGRLMSQMGKKLLG